MAASVWTVKCFLFSSAESVESHLRRLGRAHLSSLPARRPQPQFSRQQLGRSHLQRQQKRVRAQSQGGCRQIAKRLILCNLSNFEKAPAFPKSLMLSQIL